MNGGMLGRTPSGIYGGIGYGITTGITIGIVYGISIGISETRMLVLVYWS